MKPGCLVLETGEIFKGFLFSGKAQAGELVFNTSHSGYEEIATDPSYYNQILIMTFPLQGNYGADSQCWQSDRFWIKGLICLEIQNSVRDKQWLERLNSHQIPILSSVDTRQLVLYLRERGTVWSALLPLSKNSIKQAQSLIRKVKSQARDWTQVVCVPSPKSFKGHKRKGAKLALIDFGFKKNILEEMLKRSREVCIFPSTSSFKTIQDWNPDGIVLSNGPGDPKDVIEGVKLTKKLLKRYPLFGICMGHQVLAQALGAKTYKLKFGHRGSNHPIQDRLLNKIYISSQNHGYVVDSDSLSKDIQISHMNLNDKTTAGIFSKIKNCLGVQFHPENGPGPKEAEEIFDFFIKNMVQRKLTVSNSKRVLLKNKKGKNASPKRY